MDIGKSFGYVFDDERWVTKLLIAAAILLVGVVLGIFVIPAIAAGLLLGGYGIEITRRVIRGQQPVLPEWDNWGDLFVDGVKAFVIGIVYALPIIVVSICLGMPIGILAEDAEEVAQVFSAFMSCLNFLWGIVMAFLLPAALAFFVVNDEVSAAFRIGDVLSFVRDNFKTYLLVAVMSWVAGFVGWLGVLVCGVGWLVTGPYASMVTSHLCGQGYLEASGQMPQPAVAVEEEPV